MKQISRRKNCDKRKVFYKQILHIKTPLPNTDIAQSYPIMTESNATPKNATARKTVERTKNFSKPLFV